MSHEIISLKKESPETKSALWTGRISRYGQPWIAIPRETVSLSNKLDSVIFELIQTGSLHKPSLFQITLHLLQWRNMIQVILPMIAVLLYGIHQNYEFQNRTGITACLGVLFLQISVILLNDAEDYLRLLDLPRSRGGEGVLQKGWLSAKQVKLCGLVAFTLGCLLGLPSVIQYPQVLITIGVIAALGLLSYSNNPIGIKYRLIGEVSYFALIGPLLAIGLLQACFGLLDGGIVYIGLFFGFCSWAIAHSKNIQDIEIDQAHFHQTFATRLGFHRSRHMLVGIYSAASICLVVGVLTGKLTLSLVLLPFLGLAGSYFPLRLLYQASGPASAKIVRIWAATTTLQVVLSFLLCLGLIISI